MLPPNSESPSSRSPGPSSIVLPPPPVFSSFSIQDSQSSLSTSCSPSVPLDSPAVQFHTAPSSPFVEFPSPQPKWYTPPTSPQTELVQPEFSRPSITVVAGELIHPYVEPTPAHSAPILVPQVSHQSSEQPLPVPDRAAAGSSSHDTDDAFPNVIDIDQGFDPGLGDESLNALEKIYVYSRSRSSVYREFIAHALPSYLDEVSPQEAIEYVLPLISGLAMDEEESVKEALASELVPVIWWFFSRCQVTPDDLDAMSSFATSSTTVTIPVQAFTPILGTLLLSSNPQIVGPARFAVVDLLTRMRRADKRESGVTSPRSMRMSGEFNVMVSGDDWINDDGDDDTPYIEGLFKHDEREMFRQEILHSLVIGMGRLDLDLDTDPSGSGIDTPAIRESSPTSFDDAGTDPSLESRAVPPNTFQTVNPYFPPFPPQTNSTTSSTDPPFTTSSFQHPSLLSPGNNDEGIPRTELQLQQSSQQHPLRSPPLVAPSAAVDHVTRAASPVVQVNGVPIENGDYSRSNSSRSSRGSESEQMDEEGYCRPDEEQAAIGRLSSMSIMAAVTATGFLDEDAQRAFVKEVERVGRDMKYSYVRKEASLALGALAKVVPEELVLCSLLPLFDALRWDSDSRVRHSALFALPAILPRLSLNQRRTVALETIMALSKDPSEIVRSGVLESLGEVIYTFHNDPGGPPNELLQLFLGRKEDVKVRDGSLDMFTSWLPRLQPAQDQDPIEAFYTDPERPLIIAYNFPAVALTLGPSRWGELRETYLDLARNPSKRVRPSIAASLGEIAKIIGKEAAVRDLVPVWWESIRFENEGIRTKAVESLPLLSSVVGSEVGGELLKGLVDLWEQGTFRGWRERDGIIQLLETFLKGGAQGASEAVSILLKKGLEDTVAGVREAAIFGLPRIWRTFSRDAGLIVVLRDTLQSLSSSGNFRRRVSFIACLQSLILFDLEQPRGSFDTDELLASTEKLVHDPIADVRIALARLLGVIHAKTCQNGASLPQSDVFGRLVKQLRGDASHEVKSFLPDLESQHRTLTLDADTIKKLKMLNAPLIMEKRYPPPSTFSRPPVKLGNPALTANPQGAAALRPEEESGRSGITYEGGDLIMDSG